MYSQSGELAASQSSRSLALRGAMSWAAGRCMACATSGATIAGGLGGGGSKRLDHTASPLARPRRTVSELRVMKLPAHAFREYDIRGVRSTLPFSRWLLARPEFVEARFHTNVLDELLQQRAGEPFGDLDPSIEEVAALVACLVEASATLAGSATSKVVRERERDMPAMERSWKTLARKEGLRR